MPNNTAVPTHVVESFPVDTHVRVSSDSICFEFRQPGWGGVVYLTPRLFEKRIRLVLSAPFNRPDHDSLYELIRAINRVRFKARYIRFANGAETIVFAEPLVIPARANLNWRMTPERRKRIIMRARKTPPMVVYGMASSGESITFLRRIRLGLCGNRFSVPFTHAELCAIQPYISLEQPVSLRPAFDHSYDGLVEPDKYGNNAVIDCCSLSIPIFQPKTWEDERLRPVRGLMSVPPQIYTSLVKFLTGRRVLAVMEDRLFDGVNGEWPRKPKRKSKADGQCYKGNVLTVVGSSLVFHENHQAHGEYHLLDSRMHAFGLKVFPYREHALSAAARPQLKNPHWRKPYCVYAIPHDQDGKWESTYLPNFLNTQLGAKRVELAAAMAAGIPDELAAASEQA